MDIEIKAPELGESESEATLASWRKDVGEAVAEDDVLAEIESDKITMEVTAFDNGVLKEIRKQAGDTVTPGEIIGLIETDAKAASAPRSRAVGKKREHPEKTSPPARRTATVAHATVEEAGAAPVRAVAEKKKGTPKMPGSASTGKMEERVPMSALRKAIARRLKEAQNTAAILTTFNEVNMQPVTELRARYRDAFREKHGVNLGYMSFFVKACVEGLRRFPAVNACVEDNDIIYRSYCDIGIAVSTDRGLVVPILRDAGRMDMAEIENAIAGLAQKARESRLVPDDLKGGTFSITNGGIFGSLLSTPILNPPQSAILGMHAIQKRPVAEDDRVVIHPMMYLALSYDHRIVDGREAVQFLATVKEALEFPGRMLLGL